MKKSITIWILKGGVSGEIDLIESAKQIKAAGFDGVELSFGKQGQISPDANLASLEKLKREAESIGIEFSSLSTLLLNEVSFASSDNEEKEAALRISNKMLEIASILQIPTVQMSPGKVTFQDSYRTVYENSLKECSKLAKRAEELGVTIAIENDWQKFLLSPLEFASFIDEVGSKNFGACLDTRNTYLGGYPHHWVEALGARIKKIHMTDIRRVRKVFTEFCDIGTGEIDFDITLKKLKETSYDGYATIEAFYKDGIAVDEKLRLLSANLESILRTYYGHEK